MKNLIIYGGSNTNLIKLIDLINRDKPTWKIIGYLDDVLYGKKKEVMGYPILGTGKDLPKVKKSDMFFTNNVGNDTESRLIVTRLMEKNRVQFANIIAPGVDTKYVTMGKDVTIFDGAKLGIHVEIGDHVLIRWASLVTHDNTIGNHAFIGPNVTLCGNTQVGEGAYVGAGSTVIENIKIGSWCKIGAGAVVVKNVKERDVVAGVPGKSLL